MRMWMVNPKLMCREHLLGEYRECLMFVGTLRRKCSIKGFIRNKLIELKNLVARFNELKAEMFRRNYQPKCTIVASDLELAHLSTEELTAIVPREESLKSLLYHSRHDKKGCLACQAQYKLFQQLFPTESNFSECII